MHAQANEINYYYEIHGTGEPLLLLHGGLGSIDLFEPDLPGLGKNAAGDRGGPPGSRSHAPR